MLTEETKLLGIVSPLVRYPLYKKSSFPWLGDLPQHWKVTKLRNHLTPINRRNRPDLPLLSVVREKGVIIRNIEDREENFNYIPDDLSNYKVVTKGQFAINKMKAWQGSYGVSRFDGIVSPAYYVYNISGVNGFFLSVALRSKAYVPFFIRASDGIRIGQWDLSNNELKNIPFFLPPAEEQKKIVKYLVSVDKRVKKYIRAKQKQIKLLEEMKQAIIHQAVTRGLDPAVPLKPSGFEGLGDVPEHWSVVPMKGILIKRKEVVGALSSDLLLLSLTTNGVIPRDIENPTGKYPADFDSYQLVHPGDLIFCLFDIDETPRTIGISRLTGMITGAYSVFSCENGTMANFIYYNFLDKDFRKELKPYYSGLRKVIQKERFLRIKIALPPIRELENICDFLDKKILQLNNLVTKYREQIALVTLNQTRLIADVVTGKLDVREAASQLPDELEGLLEEPDENLEEGFENGEEMEEAVPEEE